MKNLALWAGVALSGLVTLYGGIYLYIRHSVIKVYGKAMWKSWRL